MENNNRKRRLIPFHWLPASWGLKGRVRQEAEAAYYHEGEALAERLKEIEFEHLPEDAPAKVEQALEARLRNGELTQHQYEKELATLRGEPWVVVLSLDISTEGAQQGSFELDWNDLFVEELEKSGYGPAPSPEQIVNQWFTELCRNVALEAYDGVGDYSEKLAPKAAHSDVIYRSDLESKDNGKS